MEGARPTPSDALVQVHFPGSADRTVNISADIPAAQRVRISNFLLDNADIFAWSASDVPGVDPILVMHSLDVDDRRGVFQKKRVLGLVMEIVP